MSARRVMLTNAEIDALLILAGRGEDEWEAEGRKPPHHCRQQGASSPRLAKGRGA